MSSLDIYFRPHLKLNTLYQTILNSLLKQYVIYRAARDPENKIIDFEIIYENIPDIDSFPKVSDKLKYILKKSLSFELLSFARYQRYQQDNQMFRAQF